MRNYERFEVYSQKLRGIFLSYNVNERFVDIELLTPRDDPYCDYFEAYNQKSGARKWQFQIVDVLKVEAQD